MCRLQEALQLSEEQSSGMVRARREFLGALKALLRQRRALNAIIQASVPTECGCHTDVGKQHAKVNNMSNVKDLESSR